MILKCCCSVVQPLKSYHDSPPTPSSETSSPYSPVERRDSNDSQDIGSSNSKGRQKREGKDEKLARKEGITEFISVDEIINLPMGNFIEIVDGYQLINVIPSDEFNDRLDLHQSQGMKEEQVGNVFLTFVR